MRHIKPEEMYVGMRVEWGGYKAIIRRLTPSDVSFTHFCSGGCAGHSRVEDRHVVKFIATDETIFRDSLGSNKGLTECVNCGCATEKRRDFSDMSIREFCPRCKI